MFDIVVSSRMPGLETVDHYPVLAAVSGILCALLCKASETWLESYWTKLYPEMRFSRRPLTYLIVIFLSKL